MMSFEDGYALIGWKQSGSAPRASLNTIASALQRGRPSGPFCQWSLSEKNSKMASTAVVPKISGANCEISMSPTRWK
jgi:hypothetical protein